MKLQAQLKALASTSLPPGPGDSHAEVIRRQGAWTMPPGARSSAAAEMQRPGRRGSVPSKKLEVSKVFQSKKNCTLYSFLVLSVQSSPKLYLFLTSEVSPGEEASLVAESCGTGLAARCERRDPD